MGFCGVFGVEGGVRKTVYLPALPTTGGGGVVGSFTGVEVSIAEREVVFLQ